MSFYLNQLDSFSLVSQSEQFSWILDQWKVISGRVGGVGGLNPNLVSALSQTLVWAKVEVWVKLDTNKKYNKKSKNKFSLDELKAYEFSLT